MNPLAAPLDWLLDRTVVGGYTAVGYRLRGLDGLTPDPEGRLQGASIVLTGANSGIGVAACETFAELGAEVHMVCRDRSRGESALAEISERTGSDRLHLHVADLGDLEQVRALAAELAAELDSIDALVHNAGALLGTRAAQPQGHELTFAVHVLGPMLLTHELRPQLEAAAGGRVIFVTSGGMYTARLDLGDLQLERRPYRRPHLLRPREARPGDADRRASEVGSAATSASMRCTRAGPRRPGVAQSLPRFNAVTKPLLRSPEAGADTIVWLAAADRPGAEPGRLWMDRRPRPEHRVPWTHYEPGESARLYDACAELTDFEPLPDQNPRPEGRRGPAGAVRTLPSP